MGYKFNPFTGNLDAVNESTTTFTDLEISGDLTLGSGIPTTTLQAITPTADRTISFPDATGNVALVSGASGTVQYNRGGLLKGNADFTVDPDWNDAAVTFTGLKLNVTDTASAAGSNLLDLQVGGTSKFVVSATGYLRQVPIAVASLPTAAAGNAGTRIFVSDASVAAAGNFGSVVAGGGSNTVPVYSDGGAWRIG